MKLIDESCMIVGCRKFSYFDFGSLTLGLKTPPDFTIFGTLYIFCNSIEESEDIEKTLKKHKIRYELNKECNLPERRIYFSPREIKSRDGDILMLESKYKLRLTQTYIDRGILNKALTDLRGMGYKTKYVLNNFKYIIC